MEKRVFDRACEVLGLEVDLLFFDTTSTYFVTEETDAPAARDERGNPVPDGAESAAGTREAGFRTWGKSKDHRDDLPQIVIGMAVTRDGIPLRVWCWPGNTNDSALIRQVKDDLRGWTLPKVVWVADRGFTSAENRRYLRKGGNHYIIGERLRSGSAEASAALSRQGRYQDVAENLRVKEVRIAEDERFVICHSPEGAERDAAIRARMITQLKELIDGADALSRDRRAELRGVISTRPGLNRYLRVTPGGLLRVDASRAKAEENLDGKYLLRTSDPKMTAEDIALGYRQLLEVERGWRDLKQVIDLRPVYHRKESASAPTSSSAGSHSSSPASPRTHAARPGRNSAASSTASPSAPSTAPPGPSASAPRSPLPRPPSSNSSASTRPRGSTSSPRPQQADQRKHLA